jgi:hypothetical protein
MCMYVSQEFAWTLASCQTMEQKIMHSRTRYIFFCENGPIAWSKKVMNVHPFQHRGESKYLTTCAIVKEIFWFYHLSPNDI